MIRKFEKNDINTVMQIWKNENIKAHKFISKEYWKNNYNYVIRVNEHSLSTIDLLAAKSGGAKVLAMRSSNASSGSKM